MAPGVMGESERRVLGEKMTKCPSGRNPTVGTTSARGLGRNRHYQALALIVSVR